MATRKPTPPRAGGKAPSPKPSKQLQELQIVLEDPVPLDDDDDVMRIERETLSLTNIIKDLKALGFPAAEAFVKSNDPRIILEALDHVAPLRFGQRSRRPEVKTPAALIRWLVKQAQP